MAKYQAVTASSENGNFTADYAAATDLAGYESQSGNLSANGWTTVSNSTNKTSYSAPRTPSMFFRRRRP